MHQAAADIGMATGKPDTPLFRVYSYTDQGYRYLRVKYDISILHYNIYPLIWGRELDGVHKARVEDLSRFSDSVSFNFLVEWDMDKIFIDMMSWLHSQSPNEVSQVGILCFPGCAELFNCSIPSEIVKDFQIMLLSLTTAHCQVFGAGNSQSLQNLEYVGVFAGRRVFRYFDRLQSSRGNMPDRNGIQTFAIAKANVFILLGTIMAIYYTTDPGYSRGFDILNPETASYRPSTVWNAMKEHVCSMLTHHLLFVATRFGFTIFVNTERMFIRRCIQLWDKTPKFNWIFIKGERDGDVGLSPETRMDAPDVL